MKNKLFDKQNGILLAVIFTVALFCAAIIPPVLKGNTQIEAKSVAIKVASSKIQAQGSVVAANEAVLHFQTGGKLTYLPFKEGDSVYQGQTIARLDTYALQKQVELAANTYLTAKNNNGTVQENKSAGVLEGNQRTTLDTYNHNSYTSTPESQVITDEVKRIVDNSQLAQDSARLSIDLANYAVGLASLTTPISGIITHEDVNTSGVNVTPLTTFIVDDPSSLVFRAQVLENDIDYVAAGQKATIKMASGKTISGVVTKIYPEKITLADGSKGYNVDVASTALNSGVKIAEAGTVLIDNIEGHDVMLVPTWTVLANSYIWVDNNGNAQLKKVTVGAEHGNTTEILSGLNKNDRVIESPKTIISNKYQIL